MTGRDEPTPDFQQCGRCGAIVGDGWTDDSDPGGKIARCFNCLTPEERSDYAANHRQSALEAESLGLHEDAARLRLMADAIQIAD